MIGRRVGIIGGGLALVGILLMGAGTAIGTQDGPGLGAMMVRGRGAGSPGLGVMMGRPGMMGAVLDGLNGPGPGEPGFVAGTTATPRVIRVLAGPGYAFTPSTIRVTKGETITFEVTSMGGLVHEFMVGPADAVAADSEGTPEVADIAMMQTKSLTYTFDGTGPYAFACHAPGHYEAGMKGSIIIVG